MRRRTKIILAVVGVTLVWPFAQIGLIAAPASTAQRTALLHGHLVVASGDTGSRFIAGVEWI
jgi:hypothetical protein